MSALAATILAGGSVISGLAGMRGGRKASRDARKAAEAQERTLMAQLDFNREVWQDYQDTYGPMIDQLIADTNVPVNYDQVKAEASADVNQGFDTAQQITMRDMMRYGASPTSNQYRDMIIKSNLERAKASGFVTNKAKRAAEDVNYARKLAVAGMGQGAINASQGMVSGSYTNMASGYGDQARRFDDQAQSYGRFVGSLPWELVAKVASNYAGGFEMPNFTQNSGVDYQSPANWQDQSAGYGGYGFHYTDF